MTGEGLENWSGFELVGATIADQDFIAAARQDVPLLLKEIKMLKEMLANKG